VKPIGEPDALIGHVHVRKHGIYSFPSGAEYGWFVMPYSVFVFGKVKIWGEVVEHEWGYRSEFARIVSLDYGDPELLAKFRSIYGMAEPTLNLS
jgi:hypothetical protein